MHLSKLIKVLQTFDRARLTRFKKYVRSPYFAVYPPSLALFNYLAPLHPRFLPKKITVKTIAAKGKNLHTLKQQETAGVRLLRTIEKFIALEEWQKNEAEINRYKLKGFKELQLLGEFDKAYKKGIEQLNKCPEQNTDTFFERHVLTEISFNGFNAKLNRTTKNDIMPVIKTLGEFNALKTLRYLCEAINRKQFFGTEVIYDEPYLNTLLKILEPYNNSKHPYVYLFVNVYRMLSADNYEDSNLYYKLIKQFAENNGPVLSVREAMTYAVNQCLYWHNKGNNEASNEYLWWTEWKLQHNLLLEKNKLMPVTFRNIISAAFNQKSAELIKRTIKNYASYLPAEHSETNLAFANGLYYFSMKNYKEAIRFFLLAQAKEDILFNGKIRLAEWMCLYEYDRNDTDALFNHLSAFEKYLQRNKQELQHLSGTFDRFIVYGMKLLKAESSEKLNLYFAALKSEEYFTGKPWLLEKFAVKNKKTRTGLADTGKVA